MSTAAELLTEFEIQAPLTRKFIERLPEDQLLWKPHEKSMTAGQLAMHLAMVPGGVVSAAKQDHIAPPNFAVPQPESLTQVLGIFEESVTTVRSIMPTFDEKAMNALWSIIDGKIVLASMPRKTFLRDVLLSHWYQHRGQFGVYLRILGQPVPATFGPSADESPAFRPSK